MTDRVVIVGGGTMGADVAVVMLRGGWQTCLVEAAAARRGKLPAHVANGLAQLAAPDRPERLQIVASLDDVSWPGLRLVIECIPERLDLKQALFAALEQKAEPATLLTSNSSSFPISAIAQGLLSQSRMVGLHFFMPAHLVPLVEVVMGAGTAEASALALHAIMRRCGLVPVLVRRDLPGFLANRLQHALAREAYALMDAGIVSGEDVDAAVRFGFGFRYLAAGPVLQRDHAGLDVHFAAATTMYPNLAANTEPGKVLADRVAAGRLGMKTGAGFYDWTPETIAAERLRYDRLLLAGLKLLADELPPVLEGPDEPA